MLKSAIGAGVIGLLISACGTATVQRTSGAEARDPATASADQARDESADRTLSANSVPAIEVGSQLPATEPRMESSAETDAIASGSVVATALGGTVEIFDAPDGAVSQQLSNPNENGGPLVFLVREAGPDWLDVYLPVRPNGSTGWIRTQDVGLSRHGFRIEISLADHHMNVWDGDSILLDASVGVGTANTPTPGGVFYIKELLDPPEDNGPYGSFAYGLSGYSNELDSFAGGDGVVGIHGTNDPASVGSDVSHGCIRMSNDAIEYLAAVLPLGTPVEILP